MQCSRENDTYIIYLTLLQFFLLFPWNDILIVLLFSSQFSTYMHVPCTLLGGVHDYKTQKSRIEWQFIMMIIFIIIIALKTTKSGWQRQNWRVALLTQTHTHARTYTQTHAHRHTDTHTHTHTHTHIYTVVSLTLCLSRSYFESVPRDGQRTAAPCVLVGCSWSWQLAPASTTRWRTGHGTESSTWYIPIMHTCRSFS